MVVDAFIGLGSNLGDGKKNLLHAWQMLGLTEGIVTKRLSRPYLSAPLGIDSKLWFTNAVGKLETELSAGELLETMLRIEIQMGRQREKTRDRQIDLDLLCYGNQVVLLPGLIVPHPEMHKRLFVLAPLVDIAPDSYHPVLKLSASEMLSSLPAGQEARRSEW